MKPHSTTPQRVDSKRSGPLSQETAAAIASGSGSGSGFGSDPISASIVGHVMNATPAQPPQFASFFGLNVELKSLAHTFVSQSRRQHVLSLATSSQTHISQHAQTHSHAHTSHAPVTYAQVLQDATNKVCPVRLLEPVKCESKVDIFSHPSNMLKHFIGQHPDIALEHFPFACVTCGVNCKTAEGKDAHDKLESHATKSKKRTATEAVRDDDVFTLSDILSAR